MGSGVFSIVNPFNVSLQSFRDIFFVYYVLVMILTTRLAISSIFSLADFTIFSASSSLFLIIFSASFLAFPTIFSASFFASVKSMGLDSISFAFIRASLIISSALFLAANSILSASSSIFSISSVLSLIHRF